MVKRASVESPYSWKTPDEKKRNLKYVMTAVEWLRRKGFAPYASHLIDTTHAQHYIDTGSPYVADNCDVKYNVLGRDAAIESSMAFRECCNAAYFFVDFGMTGGMKAALDFFKERNVPCVEVKLAEEWPLTMKARGLVA